MDIRRSDLPLLISLDVLLEECSVTNAAKRLHLSQPALSSQLGRLRDLFGDQLLVPSESGRGMVPTAKALALHPQLHKALMDLQDAVISRDKFDSTVERRTFVVAVNDNIFTIVGMAVAQSIFAHHESNIRLRFIAPDEANLVYRMERGEIDLYVGLNSKIPEPLRSRHLISDTFQMAQRRRHPRGKKRVSLDEYCQLAHVMVSKDGEAHSSVDDALLVLGVQRRVLITVGSYNQVPLVLADTHCVATLPSRFLRRYSSGLTILDLPFQLPSFDVSMAWHPRAHDDLALQWLRDRFLDAINEPSDTDILTRLLK